MGHLFGNPYSLLLFLNAVGVFGLAVYASRSHQKQATRGVLGVLVGAGIWSLADALRIGALTAGEVLFWNKVTYIGVVMIPPAFLVFTAAYTDREHWLKPRYVGGLIAISVGAVITVFTNQWHGLWRSGETVSPGTTLPILVEELGAVHVLWNAYVLLLVVPVGLGMLLDELRTNNRSPLFRRQVGILVLGLSFPVAASILFATRTLAFDITPFGFAVMGGLMTVAMTRYRFLEIVPIARDMTLENIDSGVLVVGPDGRIVDVNKRALELLEESQDDLVGMQFRDLLAARPDVPDSLAAVGEIRETIAVGNEHYNVNISPIEANGGDAVGRVVLFTEVTEKVRRSQQLQHQKERLEEQNERLDEFAGIVAHDLRNPLQIIEANLQLVDDPTNEQQIEAIADATDRMTELVDQLLTLARTGSDVEETESLPLSVTASQAWDTVETGDATLETPATETVDADHMRLQQCFENIFRNAVEHGGESVTVTVGDFEDGFYVEDDGPGFPPEVFEHEDSVIKQYSDDGRYGLRIVDNVADAHGWNLTLTNGETGGARYEFETD